MNYTEEQYALFESALKTQEGSVIVTVQTGEGNPPLKINLMAFVEDMVARMITAKEVEQVLARKKSRTTAGLLDSRGRRLD